MVKIGVIGGGQLARMMIPAAINLGFDVRVFAEAAGSSAAVAVTTIGDYTNAAEVLKFALEVDVLTFDHEHVPAAVLEAVRDAGVSVHPSPEALRLTHNKIDMRRRLQKIGSPQPRWAVVEPGASRENAADAVGGFPCVAKKPIGGYDGKGVRVVSSWDDIADWLSEGPVLVEERVDFSRELAQLGARRPSGEWLAWDPVETRQVEGVCSEVLAPAPELTSDVATESRRIAMQIAQEVQIVGVLAVELFETRDGGLLVNELAMRPHNSGHVLTELSLTSQFEQHLRAVTDFPLGHTRFVEPCGVMVNLFGSVDHILAREAASAHPHVKIHSYQKSARSGRKAGHVVGVGADQHQLLAACRHVAGIIHGADYDG